MDFELDFEKSVEENASLYFEKSKKAKRKLDGLAKAIAITRKSIAEQPEKKTEKKMPAKKRKLKWFHSFRWFFSSDNFLVVGGRSAKSNEQIVKKHMDEKDVFIHADVQGGSVCVVKSEGQEIPDSTLFEAAQFAAVFSKAWKKGTASVDVYGAPAPQISKSAPSGTSLGTGSFMVYGKRHWFRKTPLRLAVGLDSEGFAIAGPSDSIKKHSSVSIELIPGNGAANPSAKKILSTLRKKSKEGVQASIDDVVKLLPPEGIEVLSG